MAANAPHELASGNPCCLAWQGKYIVMKKRRDCCKEAIKLLRQAMRVASDEKANLVKTLGEMAADRDTKGNDSAIKASLEKEISDLKSEISSLQQRLEQSLKEKSEETKLLKDQASSREKEISELKDLLKKETLRADNSEEEREKVCQELNKTKASIVKDVDINSDVPEVKKEIILVKNLLASQRQKTESEREKAESEKKKADQYLSELEGLRTTAHKTSSDLHTLTSNLETVKKQLEFEKQKTMKEIKRADMESAKAREQIKLAEDLSKKFEIIRARNEELKKEAELQSSNSKVKFSETEAKLEEKIRLLEMSKKTAMDWKSRADDLTQQLQEAQLVTEGLKKQLRVLSLSQKSTETLHKSRDLEKAKLRLLEKKLKFEKSRKEFQAESLKLEFDNLTNRMNLLGEYFSRGVEGTAGLAKAEELGSLKLEFDNLTNRMNLLGEYFSRGVEGTAGLAKAKGCKKLQTVKSQKNHNGEKHSDARCHLAASSGYHDQARKFSAQLIPRSGGGVSESGLGTYFSDGQLRASRGREQVSVTTSAEIAKVKPKIDTRKNGNPCLVAENSLQSRQRDSHEVVNEHPLKRKRMSEAVESRKHLSSDDKKENLQIGEKLGTLQSMVVETGYRPLEEEETLVPDMQGGSSAKCITISKKKRVTFEEKTSMQNSLEFNRSAMTGNKAAGCTQVPGKTMCLSTAKEHDAATLFLEDVVATDYMKLLELDNPEEESYYRMARESLLSPDLPQVDFLGGEILNEDENPARALDLVASNSVELCDINYSEAVPTRVGLAATRPHSPSTQNASVTVKMPPESTTSHFVLFINIEDQNSIINIFHAANKQLYSAMPIN